MNYEFWYIVTVQYMFENESGKIQKVKEPYLVRAVSVTDAEAKTIKDHEGTMMEFRVLKVDESKIVKIIE